MAKLKDHEQRTLTNQVREAVYNFNPDAFDYGRLRTVISSVVTEWRREACDHWMHSFCTEVLGRDLKDPCIDCGQPFNHIDRDKIAPKKKMKDEPVAAMTKGILGSIEHRWFNTQHDRETYASTTAAELVGLLSQEGFEIVMKRPKEKQ